MNSAHLELLRLIHFLLHIALFTFGVLSMRLFRPKISDDSRQLQWAFVVAYLLRACVILLLHAFSRDGIFMLDDRGYDEQGMQLASIFPALKSADISVQLATTQVGYPVIVAFVYLIGGHSILSAKLLNAFFGACLAPVMYWLTSELGFDDPGLPRRAVWLAALFPFDIAWAGFLMRDTILEVLFAVLIASTVSTIKRRSYWFLIITALTLYVLDLFRFYAVFIWVGAVALAATAWAARRIAARFGGFGWAYSAEHLPPAGSRIAAKLRKQCLSA